jgi:hypothetical protein
MNLSFKRFVVYLMIPLSLSTYGFSQSHGGIVKGNVTDTELFNLQGALIILMNTNIGAIADMNGNYIIENVPYGSYEIRCSFAGYEVKIDTIELSNNNPKEKINFRLQKSNEKIPGLVPFFNDTIIYLYKPTTLWDGRTMLQREELTVYKKNETTTLLDTVLKYLTTSFFNNQYESYKEKSQIELQNLGLDNIKAGQRDYILAIVNIEDKDSVCMTSYFQGTTGAYTTFLMIVANILQPQLSDAMIDGLIVLYNKKELEELSHINLSGIITYKEIRDQVYRAYNFGF